MIHEATFEDTDEGRVNAVLKRHSTAGEAVGVADASDAVHCLLTHFSARYPKLPVINLNPSPSASAPGARAGGKGAAAMEVDVDGGEGSGTGLSASTAPPALVPSRDGSNGRTLFVAYDLMRVRGSDFVHLPRLLPAMHALFKEDEEGEEGDAEGEGKK